MANARPCIDFLITQRCNYRCEYCSQSKKFAKNNKDTADDATINAFLNLIKTLDKDFEITISGGEPLCHERFFEVIEKIKEEDLKLSVISNFSFPAEYYEKIIDVMGENFAELFVSFHPTQIKDFEAFKGKVHQIKSYKKECTKFSVGAVVSDENVEILKNLAEFLEKEGIKFCPQHMRVKNSYVQYQKPAADFISKHAQKEPGEIIKTFGKNCLAGCKFLLIYQNGEAYRCYSSRFNRGHILGNIKDKNFKMFNSKMPCLNTKCTCPKPISRNMLNLGQANYPLAIFKSAINFLHLPFLICKNFDVITAKLKQGATLSKKR